MVFVCSESYCWPDLAAEITRTPVDSGKVQVPVRVSLSIRCDLSTWSKRTARVTLADSETPPGTVVVTPSSGERPPDDVMENQGDEHVHATSPRFFAC